MGTLSILVIMVQIGKIVKYDTYGRITCPSILAELLDLEKGVDEVTWNIEDGKIVVKKITKQYPGGFEFETALINERLHEYEEENKFEEPEEVLDFEEAQARALDMFKRDQEAKAVLKAIKKK